MKVCSILSRVLILLLGFPFLAKAQLQCYQTPCVQFGTVTNVPATNSNASYYNNYYSQLQLDSWGGSGSPFSGQWPQTIGYYAYASIPVTFSPIAAGTYSGSVSATYHAVMDFTYHVTITITASGTYAFSASGYVAPKYVILGVTYAPPGPQSYVDYTNSTFVSSTTSLNSSFTDQTSQSISISTSAGVKGWNQGTVTASASTTVTEQLNSSSSITVSKTSSLSNKTPGPANPYIGINHDYDYIWVWLNPLLLYTITGDQNNPNSPNSLQWNGYGYWTRDPAGFDVYGIWVGYLNGDFGPMPADVAQVFARTWAPNNADGSGPGLTSTDFQNIMLADPYWQCGMASHPLCPTTVDATRFTQTLNNQPVLYQQAPPGGNPGTQTYVQQYTTTSTQGQGAQFTFAQTFAVEEQFTSSWIIAAFKYDLKQSNTLTWSHGYNHTITNTSSQTDTLSVTGAPCVVSGGTCNPAYTGPTQFDVYQDNLFGTFLLSTP